MEKKLAIFVVKTDDGMTKTEWVGDRNLYEEFKKDCARDVINKIP